MKAIGYKENLPIEDINSLQDIELNTPKATGRDLLVEIKAISVNPADYKVRAGMPIEGDDWKVIGWDATGIVKEVGEVIHGSYEDINMLGFQYLTCIPASI